MELPRIGKKIVDIELDVVLRDGLPGTVFSVDVGFSPPGGGSETVTSWLTLAATANTATVTFAGPQATGTAGALVAPATGGDVWARVTDAPEVDAARVGHVRLT